jgi:hypothetical protein
MKVEDQLLLLRRREPEPTERLAALRQRRLDVTRERLAKVEGIPEARLQVAPDGAPAAAVGSESPAPPTSGAPPSPSAPTPASPPATAGAPPGASAPAEAPPAGEASASAAAPSPSQGGRVEFGITGEGD